MKKLIIFIMSVSLLMPTATIACWDDDWDDDWDDSWSDDDWDDDDWDDDYWDDELPEIDIYPDDDGDDDVAWDDSLPNVDVYPDNNDDDYDWGLDDDWWRTDYGDDDDDLDDDDDFQEDDWDDYDSSSSSHNKSVGKSPITEKEEFFPEDSDKVLEGDYPKTMTPQGNSLTCVPCIMSYVLNGFFGKNVSVNDICTTYVNQHKDEDGIWDDKYNPYRNGVLVEDLQPLMDAYFTTVDFTSYKDAIDAGYPVMTDVKSNVDGTVHNVLVVGYNLDWDVIYMDPAFGRIMRSDFSDLLDDYHYVITGVKNK